MHEPAYPLPASVPQWRHAVLSGIAIFCVLAYAFVLAIHISASAGGSDSSGYFNNARLLSYGKFATPIRSLPGHEATEFGEMVFQPLGFRIQPKLNRLVPIYPIGYSLHLLAVSWLFGWDHAAVALNLFTALMSGAALWALARQLGLSVLWAGLSVVLLCLCPLFLFSAVQPMSDLLTVGWSLLVLSCAFRARAECGWGLLCGIALGVALLVRPTNVLLCLPVLVAVGFRWKHLFAVGLGGLPGAAVFTFYNWQTYGSPFVTGYGDISSIFGLRFLPHNLVHFGHWIPVLLSPVIALALLAPFLPGVRRREYASLGAWFLVLTGFYVLYYHSGETWWYLRFILPGFPILILAAVTVIAAGGQIVRLRPTSTSAVAASVLLFVCWWDLRVTKRFEVMTLGEGESNYPDAAHWAQKNLPPNSAIFCMQVSGAFFYYGDFLLIRWEQVASGQYAPLLAVLAEQQRPVYAALFEFETPAALEKVGGHWTKLTRIGQVTFWQRQP